MTVKEDEPKIKKAKIPKKMTPTPTMEKKKAFRFLALIWPVDLIS